MYGVVYLVAIVIFVMGSLGVWDVRECQHWNGYQAYWAGMCYYILRHTALKINFVYNDTI